MSSRRSPTTTVGVGLWGATPLDGVITEYIGDVPPGPHCLTVWQFDQGYKLALAPTAVMIDGGTSRVVASREAPRAAFRTPAGEFIF